MDSGGRPNVLRRSDLRLACVSSGLKRWALFCVLNLSPHYQPTELAVLRRSSFFLMGRTCRAYLSHLIEGRQLNDWDATLWRTDRAKAACKGLSKSKGCSFAARPAVSKEQLCQLVRPFSFRDGFILLAVIIWVFPLRVKSEAIPMRRREPA